MSRHQAPGSSSSPKVHPGSTGAPPHPAGGRKGAGHTHRSPQGEDGFVARGVVWLGVAEEGEEAAHPTPRKPPPALQLLGYPHGPRILDVLRSGGR
jgi:hypothetical protein